MNIEPPNNFDDFIINKNKVNILKKFNINNLSNILIYGKENTGKKTLVYNFLKYLYNVSSINTHKKEDSFKYKNKNYSCTYTYSKYYYDIDFLENIKQSKYIINIFLKSICNNKCIHDSYRIIIIRNINVLDTLLLKSFTNILEKYHKNNRFILLIDTDIPVNYKNLFNFFFTLRSTIDKKELEEYIKINNCKLSKKSISIIKNCNNLYHINTILKFKSLKNFDPILTYIKKIYTILKKNNNILFIIKIKEIIYELYLLNFNMSKFILKFINFIIKKNNIQDDIQHILYHLAAEYDPRSKSMQPFTLMEIFFIKVKEMNICL
jgi:DNA polymerase III delta prime subunit